MRSPVSFIANNYYLHNHFCCVYQRILFVCQDAYFVIGRSFLPEGC